MRISYINNIQINNYNKINSNYNKNKTSNVILQNTSFGNGVDNRSFAEFDRWAKSTDFKSAVIDIVKNPRNQNGCDSEGYIYNIPNCDKWILKKHKQTSLYPRQVLQTEYTEVTDIAPRMNLGQKIASLWVPVTENTTSHFYVHKKTSGDSKVGMSKMLMKTVSAFSSKVHLELLSKLANLPQDSFDKLASEVNYITQKGYYFDSNELNTISVDTDAKEINILGLIPNNDEKKSQHTEVLYSMLGGDFSAKFRTSHRPDVEKNSAEEYSNIITKKYSNAVRKIGDNFDNTEHFLQVFNYLRKAL